ncbi:MAG: restriction endonuclease subunit R, partial [Cyanobacteria bacterium REEB65]|nr:restriction endonuclease subunit R [Cyanobacteria bacterium REEB65]
GRLALDDARNAMILDDVVACVKEGRHPVVLTSRREHLRRLAAALGERLPNTPIAVMRGAMKAEERMAVSEARAAADAARPGVILATGSYLGEGFDEPRLDTLFLALPISFKGLLIQYTGRIHRIYPGKEEVRVYDYIDQEIEMCRNMAEKRARAYKALGYTSPGPQPGLWAAGRTESDED